MIWIGSVLLGIAVIAILWRSAAMKDGISVMAVVFAIVGFNFIILDVKEPANRFKNFLEDINLRQVSIVGSDIFERKIRITYENGKLVSVVAVPKTIVKIETPELEKKVEGK